MNPAVISVDTRKSQRNLWRSNGIKETEQEFITEIKVEMFNHQGALANLTAAINTTTSNIQSLNTEEKDGRVYSTFIRLTARDRVHLANIMRKIRVMARRY
ncbi:guanosine-3',5'-bis(diphosphate) 3'-pyrophosphohydrolase [Salmonella enterica subsp. enterica]|uniref:Guanosine-3',5'-bis(Diphosphate) 3'-pyrophosphohydrolase n=1 Tax=Salmonella enterica I TaxID=59201 RepID=A0A3S4GCD5_SALET|nr:guanosine-3',5'-bis(diphosphate) 3'-pyrophosphohydrolase [Salmonella enterica subsp. enterica]